VEAEQRPHPKTQVLMDLEAAEERNRQLVEALASRTVLGQATGIIMERYHVDSDEAFARLVKASSESNRKVREIARELVASGHAVDL
jgi:AmiR/NasT family two-component response regulator